MRKQMALLLAVYMTLGSLSFCVPGINAAWFGKNDQPQSQQEQKQIETKKVPAFPGAEGAGMYVTGGRGGTVYEVTTLADYAKNETPIRGSLRDAVSGSNRIIVFRVGGVIHLKETLKIIGNNLTIAGQTAPGDGIVLTDYEVVFGDDKGINNDNDIMNSTTGNNIIMRYIRVRPGDKGRNLEVDATWSRWHHDIIIDHCSFGWSSDETLSIYGNINTTVQWCLIAESMTMSKHDKGRHGYGAIFGGKDATVHHNLLANNTSRSPRIDGQGKLSATATDFINNVIYNWGFNSLYGGQGCTHTNLIANYYKPGPGTQDYFNGSVGNSDAKYNVNYRIANPSSPGSRQKSYWYIKDNYVAGYPAVTADNSKGVYTEDPANTIMADKPFEVPNTPVIELAEKAYEAVLAKSGATLPKRDWLDQRIVNDVKNGTGRFINTPPEAGGLPDYQNGVAPTDGDHDGMPDDWEIAQKLNPKDPKDGSQVASNGYTHVENYLNSLVSEGESLGRLNPEITLKTPETNQLVTFGTEIVFKADAVAQNTGAKIAKVAFYAEDAKLGEVTAAPYEFTWKDAPEGTHYVSAVATDTLGYQTQSNIRVVHVNDRDNLISGWQATDIGAVPIQGNHVFKEQQIVLKGSGRVAQAVDPTNTAKGTRDAFHFVYKKIPQKATIVAKIDDFTFVDNSALSGLMVRKSLQVDAPMAFISIQLEKAGPQDTGKAVVVKARDVKGGRLMRNDKGDENLGFYNRAAKGYWLRLARDGNNIEAAYSRDGLNWISSWKGTVGIGDGEAYLGLAVDAAQDICQLHNYNRVVFSGVTLNNKE
jgi:hypothetical protein